MDQTDKDRNRKESICQPACASKLEFDKVKQLWAACAVTEYARKAIQEVQPFLREAELAAALRETTQARFMIEKCGTPPLSALAGIQELLDYGEKGQCLIPAQLETVAQALTAVKRMKEYLDRGRGHEISLAYCGENLDPLEELRQEIVSQVWNEQVSDNASRLLKDLRGQILRAEEKMREKADACIRAHRECMSDSFSTIRNGHVCIPVKKEYKFKIGGTVIDKSATGSTLFIEPVASAKHYQELQELRIDEENEVRRILYQLTVLVGEYREPILQDIRTMEKMDFCFSKGKLSLEYQGVEPAITWERRICLQEARHPLMEREACVPLEFAMGEGIRGVVITGPNTGGKTVALKTVALNCMMAQCGLHVSCREARLCMHSNFLCDIGDGQNLSENLSTFSAHIVNVLEILKKINRESLVVMDELGSGTDPAEGMGIAIAILEELKKSGAHFLVTTHYPEVKTYAQKEEGLVNARMSFDKENLKPLYQMVIGEAGESCAFYIAGRLGMPGSMLHRAALEAYGKREMEKGTRKKEHVDWGGRDQEGTGKETGEADAGMPDSLGWEGFQHQELQKDKGPRLVKKQTKKIAPEIPFRRGDSVMVLPDHKIGIVCQEANEKGVLRVQLPGRKIWISHKRVRQLVAAEKLYPPDYDFSIIFDTVEHRKQRHDMERKHVEGKMLEMEDP